jgi:hypothetical protein
MRTLRTRLAASVRSAMETHLSILDGLAAELPDDPVLDGKVAFLSTAAAKPAAKRGGTPGSGSPPSEASGA